MPSAKELAAGKSLTVDFDLTKMDGWKPMKGTVSIRGVYKASNEFRGNPDWPKLQNLWEGRLVTEPVKTAFVALLGWIHLDEADAPTAKAAAVAAAKVVVSRGHTVQCLPVTP